MSDYSPLNPLIVQSDYTILVEVASPRYAAVREQLLGFAEIVKSPEHIHTYRITPLAVWNGCAAGLTAPQILTTLNEFAKYPIADHILTGISDFASRYGRVTLQRDTAGLTVGTDSPTLAVELANHKQIAPLLGAPLSETHFRVADLDRGKLKQRLIKIGYPAKDIAGYASGEAIPFQLAGQNGTGPAFQLRPYQQRAAEIFHGDGHNLGGSGVIVLPCGAGKTIVGLACMARLQTSTLILTTNVTAVRQWRAELLDKSSLTTAQIGEYSGACKEIKPVTISTYQIMTYRPDKSGDFPHLHLFDERDWGLIIYDEVHMLPAPVFQVTASLQARRRLGLTATLVREDNREDEVFALIGPKKMDVGWKEMEKQGWVAQASCHEIRVPMADELKMRYALADKRQKFRIAAENPDKHDFIQDLLQKNSTAPTLIIGMYVGQLRQIAQSFDLPLITGSTGQKKRDQLFAAFKSGEIRCLVVSKVANFAVDLPDASVAIQVSGTFGSRQEEAQRLGRILRPKAELNQALFYTLVSQDTVEQDFALKRQLFLCEQGYEYHICQASNTPP